LLAGGACSALWSVAAAAQSADAEDQQEAGAEPAEPAESSGAIIVTGSRIQRQNYNANSPMVTVDEDFLRQSSTSAIEQQLNKLPQFVVSQSSTLKNNDGYVAPAASDIQPNATNTPGAATVSLRGVGANRTLVLIDGRRGAPGNASGAVDVSTIPSAALERVEIISGGASATYGADAIAGVTNIILKKNYQGLELDAQMGLSQFGDALDYQISGIMGADIADGRGNVSIAMSMNTREPAYERDRPWYRDLWNDPQQGTGGFGSINRPGAALTNLDPAGVAAVWGGQYPLDPANTSLTVYGNPDGTLFTTGFESPGVAGWQPWDDQADWHRTAVGTMAYTTRTNYLTVPTTRYSFLGRGNYEINDWIGVFGTGMFSHNSTYTRTQASTIQTGWDVLIPWGSGVYTGNSAIPSSVIRAGDSYMGASFVDADGDLSNNPTNPAFQALYGGTLACALNPIGGCTNTQAFQQVIPQDMQTLLDTRRHRATFGDPGYVFGAPAEAQPWISDANDSIDLRSMFPTDRETFSDVTTYNLVAGLEGTVPGNDWTWEAFVNHSVSTTLSRQTGMYSLERVRAVYTAPNFGQGFTHTGNSQGNGFGAATGECTTGLDVFNMLGHARNVSQDCREAIAADLSTRSEMRQTIVEANLQGGLFDLPAGQVRFALGASYRELAYEFVTDTLTSYGRSFLDQAIGIYPSSNSNAYMDVKELYGELLIPVLQDLPLVEEFNLELGGRMSNYSSTGTSYTFKILGDWEVTDWLRFRGGFNRAERAPNLAELYLSPQQTFGVDTIGDLCSTLLQNPLSANPATNPGGAQDVKAVCSALMTRDNGGTAVPDTDFFSYYGAFYSPFHAVGPGFSFSTGTGNAVYRELIDDSIDPLRPEVADTWTIGAVIRSPLTSGPLSRLQMSVDYFNIRIEDPIGLLSVGAMQQLCLDPGYNPAVVGAAGPDGIAGIDPGADGILGTPDDIDGTLDNSTAGALANANCGQVKRSPSTGFGALNSNAMTTTYRNDGLIKLSGIDAQLSWGTDLGPGSLFASLNASYMFDFKVKELETNPLVDYAGTIGVGAKGLNFGGSIRYRVFGSLGYSWGPANLSLSWQHTPATEDAQEAISHTENPGFPSSNVFNLNGGYQLSQNVRLRFGIDNLFYKRPRFINVNEDADPAEGELTGGSWNFFDDTQGRRFSLGANIRF
jgi:outer membrane receptor protein involved in Fe transport